MSAAPLQMDVEFSLALENRTGKYFICRDVLKEVEDFIHTKRYWRSERSYAPRTFQARVLWRILLEEIKLRSRSTLFGRAVPRMRPTRPVFFTDPLETLLYRLAPQDIVLCHDMGPLTHPELYISSVPPLYRNAFDEIAITKPHILFVSRASLLEYETLYGPAYASVHVTYPWLRSEVSTLKMAKPEGIRTPFLLTVGNVGSRKNQARSIEAFQKSGLAAAGWSYVICGGPDAGYEEVASRAAAEPSVVLTGYASEAHLRWLYGNAEGFVLPSLLEGFGIPSAEAVKHGLIPLVGRGGALHEVVGDGAILVDPTHADSITAGMLQLAGLSKIEKQERLEQLTAHTNQFSRASIGSQWRDTFLEILTPLAADPAK